MTQNMYAKIDATGNAEEVIFPAGHTAMVLDIAPTELAELSAAALLDKGWVQVQLPPMPKDGYRYSCLPSVQNADGLWVASWAQQETPDRSKMLLERSRMSRMARDMHIREVSWRYERYARNERLGLEQQDSIEALDAYVKALADVPEQAGFPWDIQWPTA